MVEKWKLDNIIPPDTKPETEPETAQDHPETFTSNELHLVCLRQAETIDGGGPAYWTQGFRVLGVCTAFEVAEQFRQNVKVPHPNTSGSSSVKIETCALI